MRITLSKLSLTIMLSCVISTVACRGPGDLIEEHAHKNNLTNTKAIITIIDNNSEFRKKNFDVLEDVIASAKVSVIHVPLSLSFNKTKLIEEYGDGIKTFNKVGFWGGIKSVREKISWEEFLTKRGYNESDLEIISKFPRMIKTPYIYITNKNLETLEIIYDPSKEEFKAAMGRILGEIK